MPRRHDESEARPDWTIRAAMQGRWLLQGPTMSRQHGLLLVRVVVWTGSPLHEDWPRRKAGEMR